MANAIILVKQVVQPGRAILSGLLHTQKPRQNIKPVSFVLDIDYEI